MTSAAPDVQVRLEPKLLTCLHEGISARQLAQDVLVGVIVGIVARRSRAILRQPLTVGFVTGLEELAAG